MVGETHLALRRLPVGPGDAGRQLDLDRGGLDVDQVGVHESELTLVDLAAAIDNRLLGLLDVLDELAGHDEDVWPSRPQWGAGTGSPATRRGAARRVSPGAAARRLGAALRGSLATRRARLATGSAAGTVLAFSAKIPLGVKLGIVYASAAARIEQVDSRRSRGITPCRTDKKLGALVTSKTRGYIRR
jgi:hypothetical protein